MATVLFFSEKITFRLREPQKTIKWLKRVCAKEGRSLGTLTYVFCSDGFLRKLNVKYLKHSTLTDTLSFPATDSDRIEGEIYISIQRVKSNARTYQESFGNELRRVMVHGLLHFLGYRDKKASEKAQMREKEEACLSLWR